MNYFKEKLDRIDKWKHLRVNLFRNEEPKVETIGATTPFVDGVTTESLPAFTARQSHESEGTFEDDIKLNSKLILWGHLTPLESVQMVFHVTGISKSLAGQWTRHRAGIGWTFRSTRYVDASQNSFVYPALEYIDDENVAKEIYHTYEIEHIRTINTYDHLLKLGVKNQEIRRIMPVGWSTAAYVYVNARALRHFFELRLSNHAEWEIRRLAYITFNHAMRCPTLFEDLLRYE